MERKKSLNFINSDKIIKPQHAVQRLYELTKHNDTYITTEVGQHQMWAAQHYKFNKPNRWMTSGGLGTMVTVFQQLLAFKLQILASWLLT